MKPPRLAVLADIHGNVPALDKVLDHIATQEITRLLVAGDLVGGPQGDQVVERLSAHESTTVLGNSEEYLLDFQAGRVVPEQRVAAQFAYTRACFRRTGQRCLATLAGFPSQRSYCQTPATPIRIVHGSTRSSTEPLDPQQRPERIHEILAEIDETVLLCGHTHHSWLLEAGDKMAANPGSVGGPTNGDCRAQYAVLSWEESRWHVTHHAVSYDLEETRSIYQRTGFLEEAGPIARAQLEGIFCADRTVGELVRSARDLARAAGLDDVHVVPDEIWERAVDSFEWKLPYPS